MIYSKEVEMMCPVAKGAKHEPAPIPEEGKWVHSKEIKDISGFTHGVGWCAPQQGACKLTLNVKEGIIEEALIETIGCSGMTHSAAMAAEILQGKTAYVRGKKLTGTMKNNSAVAGTISSKDEQYTVPQGYHDGSGKVGIIDTEKEKLVPANIREGITLLGVEGTMSGTEDAKPQAKTVTPKTTEQTVLPDTEEGYNYLSQVTVAAIPYQESENPAGGTTVTIG